ncbi:MAG: precorrin-3B C17-methyltransferase / cobalt-factor methyltransferase [Moorella sp. (in: firmicutes)]|nr:MULTISPECIES: precorrin-3B C(17)-methyltransferase [unclassified Moorella (in: firmicutes)]MDK2815432.1 precorrin-3B C17-methyltransferase / cobalt-factor methyltransferase [Moorella sp. (in: firmicutes)]MDK2894403.1 precorrin-3B C17-methyltransferase / cobalt-factor methyltransferase [Moorella sp. (in: firmicutes)]GEA15298.1 precorrin-3B C(17)-methyltransferase [Moorella sp. E308F]GEA19841.1 precorrin-3B C(17)-methyltransferase [Moorella sp. E306M]
MSQKELPGSDSSPGPGEIMVVGLGPGREEEMTPRARQALARAEVIVGYRTYIDLIASLTAGREVVVTGMTGEVARCREAVARAAAGARVAVISSGDPGVYGMAGLILEVLAEHPRGKEIMVRVIPGVTAATAAAAVLGAPLMHDFAVISLSDRLTPWEVIARRLELAAAADFVLVLYNPRSHGRPDHLRRARDIILQYRRPSTPVGVVRNAGREGEEAWIRDLATFLELPVDMVSTVIIGNSQTRVLDGRLVTPRGYRL